MPHQWFAYANLHVTHLTSFEALLHNCSIPAAFANQHRVVVWQFSVLPVPKGLILHPHTSLSWHTSFNLCMIFSRNTIPIPRPPTGAASNCREPYYHGSTKKLKKSTYFCPKIKINICCDSIFTCDMISGGIIILRLS
jgi:hypothetical protein